VSDEPTATDAGRGATKPESELRGGDGTSIASPNPAVVEALEVCAGSVLALEASLDKMPADTPSDRETRDAIEAAIELVTAALVTVRDHAPGTASSELALGFVNRAVHGRPDRI
jgi:hypothetical protein